MEKIKAKSRAPRPVTDVEDLLERYYSQLLKWGAVLTRGDRGLAQDIVHDLCLHFTLARPDLSQVANLDGYLYACLRHIYLSGLARSVREAMHMVSVADFDSIQFALSSASPDSLLQKQNDLRRICRYTVWRKNSSKSASYLILLFFHGYSRREVAEIACLPIAAIYNKLKIARTEVKSNLEESGKLRIATRDVPPDPELRLSPVSSGDLFDELRETILRAKTSECIPAEALLSHYRVDNPKPVSCSFLSHIVSCERCLSVVDQHLRRPTSGDRESPEDFGCSMDGKSVDAIANESKSFSSLMRAVRRQRDRVYEHRPRTLSIAVNGKITAFHDVQGERSTLSSRIEYPEKADFVEVFTEHQIRLALLPIDERPPEGPNIQTQRVRLSDDRWLELALSFDGLGLHSEVTYFDPALAVSMAEEEADEELPALLPQTQAEPILISNAPARRAPLFTAVAQYFREMMLFHAPAWAAVFACILCTAGFFIYRHARPSLDANALLRQSVQVESSDLQGQTEHQVLHVEVVSGNGQIRQQGTIDLWKDGNGARYLRRLYDGHHRLMAAEWQKEDGAHSSHAKKNGDLDRVLLADDLWKQDVSSRAFSQFSGREAQVRTIEGGYELTVASPLKDRPQLVSATLVLDRGLHPIRERMQVRNGVEIEEVRFVQADYQLKPSSSVPDATFAPEDQNDLSSDDRTFHSLLSESYGNLDETVQLARLQVAVLYQLNQLGADTGDPIAVVRTAEGHVRISGTVADEARWNQIRARLEALNDHQLLDLRLISPSNTGLQNPQSLHELSGSMKVYDVGSTKAPANAILRRYFSEKGFSGARLDAAVARRSSEVLETAQHALQSAYALDRLGSALSPAELGSIGPSSQHQWTEMVEKHASELQIQLHSLNDQLVEISSQGGPQGDIMGGDAMPIANPVQFARVANHLLHQVQDVNRSVGKAFTTRPSDAEEQMTDSLLASTLKAIPLRETEEIRDFAGKMTISARASVRH